MKTKNMRKKALVSSLAMLLVAVLALGGATYAWFSTNTAATAYGVNITSKEETSLQFAPAGTSATAAADADKWGPSVPIDSTNFLVTPCSSTNGYNLYKVTNGSTAPSEQETQITGITSAAYGTGATDTKDYYKASFAARCTKSNSYLQLTGIDFTTQSGAQNEFADLLRVSVQIGNETSTDTKIFYTKSTTPGNWTLTEAASNVQGVTFADLYTNDTTAIDGQFELSKPTVYDTPGSAQSATGIFATAFTPGSALNVTVRVWLEGNDSTCDNTMMAKTVQGMTLSFTAYVPST